MNFRVTVRDGRGGISDAGTVLTVINTTTPFKVLSQNSTPVEWGSGSTKTINWQVSGTNAAPINAGSKALHMPHRLGPLRPERQYAKKRPAPCTGRLCLR